MLYLIAVVYQKYEQPRKITKPMIKHYRVLIAIITTPSNTTVVDVLVNIHNDNKRVEFIANKSRMTTDEARCSKQTLVICLPALNSSFTL